MTVTNVSSPTNLSSASSPSSASLSSAVSSTKTLGQNDFLKLLTAQMQYQDPMAPTDDTQFVAELAQFSSLQQEQNINTGVGQLQALQQTQIGTQASALVGKTVTANSNAVSVSNGNATPINFQLAGNAQTVTAQVYNGNGALVQTLNLGPQAAGQQSVPWKGTDAQGSPLPTGNYTVTLSAQDSSNAPIGISQTLIGVVTGVDLSSGTAQLMIGNAEVSLSQVQTVQ